MLARAAAGERQRACARRATSSPSPSSRVSTIRCAKCRRSAGSSASSGSTLRATATSGFGPPEQRVQGLLRAVGVQRAPRLGQFRPRGPFAGLGEHLPGGLGRRHPARDQRTHAPDTPLLLSAVEPVPAGRPIRREQAVTGLPRAQDRGGDPDTAAERADPQRPGNWCGHGARCFPDQTLDKPSTNGSLPRDMPGGKSDVTPTLVTQFAPPLPPFGLVERSRLVERLERGLTEPVTLVCGPAGSGKTALLSTALGPGRGHCVAWVSLEPGDDDPARFWEAVLASMRIAGVAPDGSALAALAPPVRDSRRQFMPLLVNALAELEAPMILVARRRPRPALARVPERPRLPRPARPGAAPAGARRARRSAAAAARPARARAADRDPRRRARLHRVRGRRAARRPTG